MNPPHPLDDSDPKRLLDWLVVQHTCEWCGGTIEQAANANGNVYAPPAAWRCWEIKRIGYTIKHWKHWRVCFRCGAKSFETWIFPVIKSMMPEHEALSAIMQVQPMSVPAGEIFYADYIPRVRGERVNGAVLDVATFREPPMAGAVERLVARYADRFAARYAEREINPELFVQQTIQLDYKITADGVERRVLAPSGVCKI